MIDAVSHIGIAVNDLPSAIALYERLLNRKVDQIEKNEKDGIEIAFFRLDNMSIELISPTRPDSTIAKFIEKRGEGIHHIALKTDDITKEMNRVESFGLKLISREAKLGSHGTKIVFIHPRELRGVLVELVQ